MNVFLLDTHILLWWLSNDKKLSPRLIETISNERNGIFVSVVTLWEIVIKKKLNKLIAPDNLKELLIDNGFQILSITEDHVLYIEHLPLIHSDPFDRLLIAQSFVEDMTIITADKIFMQYNIKI